MDGSLNKPYFKKRNPINICLGNLGLVKSVKCDHPCSEGYEVENLVSRNLSERNKGFLGERFIKPPVTLSFEFTCEIDLKYIMINSSVGAQKSSGIELSIQHHSNNFFEPVCSGVLKGNDQGFVFHRHGEDVRAQFNGELCFRPFKSARNLSNVKVLRIKIFKTHGSSVPALGKVDIWGVPRKIFPQKETITASSNSTHSGGPISKESNKSSGSSSQIIREKKPSLFQCAVSRSLEIPEDFIDPITCNMMCQPVTLPCGKVIDVSTLETYERAESQWGRAPSDPFTGVLFTSSSKPIAASDLKARIDKFLCDNSNHPELKNIPRTVGRSLLGSQKSSIKPSVSKLVSVEREGKILPSIGVTNNSSNVKDSKSEIPIKRRKVRENENQPHHIQSSPSPRQSSSSIRTFSVSQKSESTAISFQERMERSLELSLKSTLSSLPSFTADDKECDGKSLVECNVCKLCENLFTIPCSHFICRKCLISLKAKGLLSCELCKVPFKSHDVQKVHVSK